MGKKVALRDALASDPAPLRAPPSWTNAEVSTVNGATRIEYMRFEILELEVDAPLDAELFHLELPPGVTFTAPPTFDRPSRFRHFLQRFPLRWRGPQLTSRRER